MPSSLTLKSLPACGARPTPAPFRITAFTCVFQCFPCDPSCGSASWATPEFTQHSAAPMVKMTRSKTFQAYLPSCHRTYSCIHCRAHLANHDELISKVEGLPGVPFHAIWELKTAGSLRCLAACGCLCFGREGRFVCYVHQTRLHIEIWCVRKESPYILNMVILNLKHKIAILKYPCCMGSHKIYFLKIIILAIY